MNSHTVSWECINCYPLATSEQTQAHSHTLEWLLQGHLLLLTPSFLGLSLFFSPAVFFTFAPLCTTTAYQLIHSQRDTHTHAHDEHKTPSPSHVWARTQSSWLTQNWAVICVTSGLCVCVHLCVFLCCACYRHLGLGVLCGRLLSTCTSWGVLAEAQDFDLIIIADTERTWLIRLRCTREKVLSVFGEHRPPPHVQAHKHSSAFIACVQTESQMRLIARKW